MFPILLLAGCAATVDGGRDKQAVAVDRTRDLRRSYGTYAANIRDSDGHVDISRLLGELEDLHANTYNWLIAHAETDWEDLKRFLPAAREKRIRVWVTLLPPSESPPRTKRYSEPFRLDFERWGAELAELSRREPALVAWSIDDFAHNLKVFTPDYLRKVISGARQINPRLAFAPCVYYRQLTPKFVENYRELLDGILFPYRSESTTPGLTDATRVEPEVATLRERLGPDVPIIVDVYASAHSKLGPSTAEYVEQVMQSAKRVADGVHVYRHQDRVREAAKYTITRRVFSNAAG